VTVRSVSPDAALAACMAEMFGPHDVAGRDCCRTAGWAFERLFGVNPVTNANYKTNWGALRYLARFGGAEACHDALALAAGLVPCAPCSGVIGSIAVPVEASPFGWVLGINIQGNEWATKGPNGLCVLPHDCARAWGVSWV
jgi:hypothetical protein